jgi:hypothetical protein
MGVDSYRRLKVRQMGMDLAKGVYLLTRGFPKHELYLHFLKEPGCSHAVLWRNWYSVKKALPSRRRWSIRARGGRKKGSGPICRNGPKDASHKLDLTPFFLESRKVI